MSASVKTKSSPGSFGCQPAVPDGEKRPSRARQTATFSNPSACSIPRATARRTSSAESSSTSEAETSSKLGQRRAVTRGSVGILNGFDRADHVLREGDEHVDLLVGRAEPGLGLVDRDDAEQRSVRAPHRHHQRVLGVPRVGVGAQLELGDVRGHARPVDLVVRDQIGAAAQKALREERRPRIRGSRRAEQRLARPLAPVHGGDHEVALGGPVEVDRHRAKAERVGDRRGDRVDEPRQVALVADEPGDLEQASKLWQRGERLDVHGHRACSRLRAGRIERVVRCRRCRPAAPGRARAHARLRRAAPRRRRPSRRRSAARRRP